MGLADMAHDLGELFTAPRDFLKMNLLVMRGVLPTVAGIYQFTFTDMSGNDLPAPERCKSSRKSRYFWKSAHTIHVWDVRYDTTGSRGSAAYHLPYEPGTLRRGTLPSTAPLMLTSEMTGCTFGVARFNNGQIDICHANYQTKDGHIDVERLSRETAFCTRRFEDQNYRQQIRGAAVPNINRQASLGATIIGTNHPRQGWKIYAQQWENLNGTDFTYHDLIDL